MKQAVSENGQIASSASRPLALSYAGVVRVLGGCRAEVLAAFREAGGSADRWQAGDRAAMREALTRAEDRLELRLGDRPSADRLALQAARRKLEALA